MTKILVAYTSMAGSTAEVARAVGEEIAQRGFQVDVLPISEIGEKSITKNLDDYAGVVVGAPMIMGWHREALRFLQQQRKAFQRIPLAVFVMAMSLTQAGETSIKSDTDQGVDHTPVTVDEKLPKPPLNANRLKFRERYARLSNYLRPILKATRPAKPASLAVFGGRLEYGRLKWWAVLFVMLVIQAPAGDRRNWPAIREWAAGLPKAFGLEQPG
ncbi:MAG: flavodoxin domain-containing protein [Anaerolineales bacterium]|jgi:menaquinone-dependent protoporphyrinogen IX oxidase|nr:flavodoxin domain-containing protein [Anaerolineales bacterium]